MSRIKALLGEKTLQLIPESSDKNLKDFFGIDSLHVILGRNGSGKTHLLHSIARSFGPWEGPLSVITEDLADIGSHRVGKPRTNQHGVVFFTSLPYRRKIRQNKNVIDVSPSSGKRDLIGDVDVFKKVCADLDLHTSLRGYIGYPSSIFSEIFLPAILAGAERYSYSLSSNGIDALNYLARSDQNKYGFERDEFGLKSARDDLLKEIRVFFQKDENSIVRLAELASIQLMNSNYRKFSPLVSIYLEKIGFSKQIPHDFDTRLFAEYEAMVHGTLNYLHNQRLNRDSVNECSFEIHSESEAENISRENSAVRIGWSDLSSGMRALIEQFSQVRRGVEKLKDRGISNILILLDEGDAYLHLDWQRRYVQMMDRFLTSLKDDLNIQTIQVVLATHSPVIASDLPSWMITSLDHGVAPYKTFAAPIDEVILASFGSTAIGAFAAEKINALHQRLANGTAEKTDFELLEDVGDLMIKNSLLRVYKKGNFL